MLKAGYRKGGISSAPSSINLTIGILSAKRKIPSSTVIPTIESEGRRKAGSKWGQLTFVVILCMAIVLSITAISVACAAETNIQYAQVTTSKGPLNMRKTASSKASVVEKIPRGAILEITLVDEVWSKCTYNGKDGYVMTKYLTNMDLSQFRTLVLNDSGEDVLALKEKLKALYFYDTETELTGTFDAEMESVVRLFQATQGLEETGIVSPEMQALIEWGSPKNNLPTRIMTVTIKSKCASNNHVGNSWSKYYSINGESVSSGDKVEIVLGQSITIYSKMTEKDSKPDIGSVKEDVEITQDYYDNGFVITHDISVRENGGKYSGNKAHWTITYTFSP